MNDSEAKLRQMRELCDLCDELKSEARADMVADPQGTSGYFPPRLPEETQQAISELFTTDTIRALLALLEAERRRVTELKGERDEAVKFFRAMESVAIGRIPEMSADERNIFANSLLQAAEARASRAEQALKEIGSELAELADERLWLLRITNHGEHEFQDDSMLQVIERIRALAVPDQEATNV